MTWITEFNSVFFISLATIITGSLGVAIKYCLRSKCEHLSLCFGMIDIDRRVDIEANLEMKEIELGHTNQEAKLENKI